MELFPSVIASMKMLMEAGGVVASLYMGVWFELFSMWYRRRWCAVESLLEHRSKSSMCVYCDRGKDHLVVEKISNDVIT